MAKKPPMYKIQVILPLGDNCWERCNALCGLFLVHMGNFIISFPLGNRTSELSIQRRQSVDITKPGAMTPLQHQAYRIS